MRCLATALHPNIQRFYLLACLLLESTTQLHVPLPPRRLLTQQVPVTQPRSINAIGHPSSLLSHLLPTLPPSSTSLSAAGFTQ
ncbi:hypothetical protein BO83DRAFT_247502 [Aspergillus eucalypticola CBS 122712]|uniref:Secreted protein n=1 Tax=Aspergillus eucalypticola (strain CBS 122712 / IBT 29274) TaxID=1448314 RepID=A0A317VS52_ASPEC|nr:uncharacterized protein BO83DRAFT_247502 [Aspergillus eucalypticola CBS 122712]PWY75857.1 hypothetical protein BO83DRAFT_247502 [Aspergillus eucalypticola CBS 122712]